MAKVPKYVDVDGFRLPPSAVPESFVSAVKYRPKEGEVVVATYPKCGTTWMVQIVVLILRDGEPPRDAEEYFDAVSFLEMEEYSDLVQSKHLCLKTHLPFDRLNFSPTAKYIYVARHPADCVVSLYHHTKFFPVYCYSDGTFDDFFELFVRGETDFNDYFDNLLSWYAQRRRPNIFFTTFESMKADPRDTVLRVAEFLGDEYHKTLVRNGGEVLDKVLQYSSFEFMKQTTSAYWKKFYASGVPPEPMQEQFPEVGKYAELYTSAVREGHTSVGEFIRKGEVGEGKIVLSEHQWDTLDTRIEEKTRGSDVMSLWNEN